MYNPQITTKRIKKLASEKGISLARLNEICGLSVNVISQSGIEQLQQIYKNLYKLKNIY